MRKLLIKRKNGKNHLKLDVENACKTGILKWLFSRILPISFPCVLHVKFLAGYGNFNASYSM